MENMRRQKLLPSVIASFAVLTVFGAAGLFVKEIKSQARTSDVEITLGLVQMLPDRWEFELRAHNSGSQAVFIMTAPVRSNGSKGSYLALDAQDPSVLEIGIRLYPFPNYCIFYNQTLVTLQRLEPGATHVEQIVVSFPAKETSPPYKGIDFETLDKSKLRTVRGALGILPDDEGIRDFLRRKEGIGPYTNGGGLVQKGPLTGKSLYEVQEIVRTPPLKL